MKKHEILNIFSGILLVVLAAFFSIALLVQFMGIGFDNARISLFFRIGLILKSVYGTCSILIPIFLFVVACFSFSSVWNFKRAVSLLLSFFPFFTMVLAERICRTMAYYEEGPILNIKIAFTLIISLGIVVIEYLFFNIIGQKLASSSKQKNIPARKVIINNVEHKYENIPGGDKTIVADSPVNPVKANAAAASVKSASAGTTGAGSANNADNIAETAAAVEAPVQETQETAEKPVQISPVFNHVFDNLPKTQEAKITETALAEAIAERKQAAAAQSLNPDVSETAQVSAKEEIPEESVTPQNAENVTPDTETSSEPVAENSSAEKDADASVQETAEVTENAEPTSEKDSEIPFEGQSQEPAEDTSFDDSPDTPATISSLITQEEFDALTQPLTEEELAEESSLMEEMEDEAENQIIENAQNNTFASGKTLPPDFFDVDLNEEDDDDSSTAQANTVDFRGISSVFAQMDADIKEETGLEDDIEDGIENETEGEPEADIEPEIQDVSEESSYNEIADYEGDEENINESAAKSESFIEEPIIESSDEEADYADNEAYNNESNSVEAEVHVENTSVPEKPAVIPSVPARKKGPYKIPVEGILSQYDDKPYWVIDDETKQASINLKETLSEFKIDAEIIGIRKGPVVTMFEILPAPGVKLSKIAALQDNIALRLAASSVRIVAPIPGKQAVGIEVPNKDRAIVSFREIIEKDADAFKKMKVPVILGKDIEGEPQIIDLVKTPHLLIAGATGAGKSVCVNSMILSILYKRSPNEVKLILIDPKIVELKLYNDIPHLLTPVITEPKKAFQALQYCLCEMERRYALLDGMGVRDISNYNKRIEERHIATEKLPYIVVVIDEFADLMATTGKELESTISRLAAMSRAIGIHIVLATQRPSIDVITGLIKANIPSRIAFMVASKTDSRIIIDQVGAEKLLGRGDMLYASAVDPFPIRIQGTFISDNEVENVVDYVRQYGPPEYIDEEIFVEEEDEDDGQQDLFSEGADPLYEKALDIVIQAGKASASYIQRRLKIGYNRAARLVEEMEERGIVGPANGSKPREIIHMP